MIENRFNNLLRLRQLLVIRILFSGSTWILQSLEIVFSLIRFDYPRPTDSYLFEPLLQIVVQVEFLFSFPLFGHLPIAINFVKS